MDTKTYTHRVAIMEVRQVIMDVEAPNDIDSIKKVALDNYFQSTGNPEVGLTIPESVVIYPWLEQGQNPPEGSSYPEPTIIELEDSDMEPCTEVGYTEAQILEMFKD
jgi:hypothetical protein